MNLSRKNEGLLLAVSKGYFINNLGAMVNAKGKEVKGTLHFILNN